MSNRIAYCTELFHLWFSKCKNLVYEWVDFSKFAQIWAKIGSNLRKFWKKSSDFAQNLVQNWSNWYMNGSLFLEKLVFVRGLLSNSAVAHPYQKPILSTPRAYSPFWKMFPQSSTGGAQAATCRPGLSNLRPTGRMRPARQYCAAREVIYILIVFAKLMK